MKSKGVIVASCSRRVKEIVRKMDDGQMEREDMIQEANIGLLKAIERYDLRGDNFHHYSYRWIESSVKEGVAEKGPAIKIPVDLKEIIVTLSKAVKSFWKARARNPTPKELAEELGLPEKNIRKCLKLIDAGEIEYVPRAQMLDGFQNSIESDEEMHSVDIAELKESVRAVLDTMTEREREVLTLRFGLEDGFCRTFEEVGRRFNETRERIRQIEAKALRKLRHPTRIRKLEGYIDLPGE